MLTFLRKIRKSLIDSGSSRRYLLYAIGEIALVVIGILIALQINNWNENRNQKRILVSHLNTVLENLKNDSIELERLIDFRNNSVEGSKNILEKYKHKKHIDPLSFYESFLNVSIERKFDRHSNGFENLERSELFQIDDLLSIRKLISEYGKIIDEIIFWENRFHGFTESMEIELYNRGFFDETIIDWRNYLKTSNDTDRLSGVEFLSTMEKYPSISGLFFRTEVTSKDILDMYERLMGIGAELSSEIEQYLGS